jgi:hypothetical protein
VAALLKEATTSRRPDRAMPPGTGEPRTITGARHGTELSAGGAGRPGRALHPLGAQMRAQVQRCPSALGHPARRCRFFLRVVTIHSRLSCSPVQAGLRVKVTCVTPLGEETASTS